MPILTDKSALTAPVATDVMHVVDVSDTTSDPAGTSKKSTLSDVSKGIASGNVPYDNTISGLTATNIKTAIDEVAAGGGASIYDATVGATGADYTTIGAAITAGKSRLLVIDDTTETGSVACPTNTIIHGIGSRNVTIDMVTYTLTLNAYSQLKWCGVTSTSTGSTDVITTSVETVIEGCYLVYAGTTASTRNGFVQFKGDRAKIVDCDFYKSQDNDTDAMNFIFCDSASADSNKIDNCTFLGRGNTYGCGVIWDEGFKQSYTNLTITAIGDSTGDEAITIKGVKPILSNIVIDTSTFTIELGAAADDYLISNINAVSSTLNLLINAAADNGNISGVNLTGTLYPGSYSNISNSLVGTLSMAGRNGVRMSDSEITTLTLGTAIDCQLVNCNIVNAATIGGDTCQFSNTRFDAGVTVSSGADLNIFTGCNINGAVSVTGNDCSFAGCKVGADAGGGTNTITIETGATRTIVGLTRTDAAIVDSGTSSEISAGNVVY